MEDLLKEQQKTNELLQKIINENKAINELLTAEQVHEEFGIRNKHGEKNFQRSKITSSTLYHTI